MAEHKPCLTCYHMAICYKIEHYGRDIHSKIPCDLYMSIVDMETVVRCKECKHYHNTQCFHPSYGDDCAINTERAENDYCSYGERKE